MMGAPDDGPDLIENAWPPTELEEGVDYVYDDVMQRDGTITRTIIRRPRP